jgi:hypothetical protein
MFLLTPPGLRPRAAGAAAAPCKGRGAGFRARALVPALPWLLPPLLLLPLLLQLRAAAAASRGLPSQRPLRGSGGYDG